MSTSSARMLVLVGKQLACLKIVGRANFTSSIDFKTLFSELRQKGYDHFVLDLSECMLMDSTFLGVLAGFGLKMTNGTKEPGKAAIELLNPNARITELLENLGVLHLFRLTQGSIRSTDGAEICSPAPSSHSREEVTRASLEAHQTLMEINPGNVPKFKDVAQFLAEDLKRLQAGAGAQG